MLSEKYLACFEDVELNMECLRLGLNNYVAANCVAYHFESVSRRVDDEQRKKIELDANKMLIKFKENFDLLKYYTGMAYE